MSYFFVFLQVAKMEKITFTAEGVQMPSLDFDSIARWLERVISDHDRLLGRLGYMFCNDETIIRVNREFLRHDYYTDIITFDYSRRRMVSGDMYISLDTVRSNSELFGQDYHRELMRVIVHGVLHLCGIDDKGPGEREIMEAHEEAALKLAGL